MQNIRASKLPVLLTIPLLPRHIFFKPIIINRTPMNKKSGTPKGQQNVNDVKQNGMAGNQASKTKTSTSDTKEHGMSGRNPSIQLKK